MNLTNLIIAILFFGLLAYGLYWVITTFFEPPIRTPLLAIAGVILLLILLSQFAPQTASFHLWR